VEFSPGLIIPLWPEWLFLSVLGAITEFKAHSYSQCSLHPYSRKQSGTEIGTDNKQLSEIISIKGLITKSSGLYFIRHQLNLD